MGADKLIVARFQARDGAARRSERKSRANQIRVAHGVRCSPLALNTNELTQYGLKVYCSADNQVQILLCEVAPVEGRRGLLHHALCVTYCPPNRETAGFIRLRPVHRRSRGSRETDRTLEGTAIELLPESHR